MKGPERRFTSQAHIAGESARHDLERIKLLRNSRLPNAEKDERRIKAKLNSVLSNYAPKLAAITELGGQIRRDATGHAVPDGLTELAEVLEQQVRVMRTNFSFELEKTAQHLSNLAKSYRELAEAARALRDLGEELRKTQQWVASAKEEIAQIQKRIDKRRENHTPGLKAGGGSFAEALATSGVLGR